MNHHPIIVCDLIVKPIECVFLICKMASELV